MLKKLHLPKKNLKKITLFLLFIFVFSYEGYSQTSNQIYVENSDFLNINENEVPDAVLLRGNVKVSHEGVILTCNKAYFFKKENYIKAFGNVQMVQGDTLFLNSNYAEYNGKLKKSFATGNVIMKSPESILITDTINFDRNVQEAFFNTKGKIYNKDNVLESESGRYFVTERKFRFLTSVTITNSKYVIKSNHLDYYTNTGYSHLLGPSTITSKENFIYTENGFYDTKKNLAHLLKKSFIKYKDRKIEGDSLYYDRNREFASATNNVKITDSINRGVIKGNYAEIFRNLMTEKDSVIISKRAVAIKFIENDSLYIHGKKMFVTGKSGDRIIKVFNNVRFYKTDLSGKCDSLYSNQKTALTKLIGKPVLWSNHNQLSGDVIHLIGNSKNENLDSLKVLNNAFIISKDTIGSGFNQVKGQNLYGKFKENKLSEVNLVKNAEGIYYLWNSEKELIGINKSICSRINVIFSGNSFETITCFKQVEGDIYPESELPENARKLRGFIWRIDERIKSKDDIFPQDENVFEKKVPVEKKAEDVEENNKELPAIKNQKHFDKKKIN